MIEKLFLIRHGVTEANEKRIYCGISDMGLSEKGIEKLLLKRDYYQNLVSDKALYFTSGYRRTEQTLNVLFGRSGKQPKHTVVKGFRELDFGIFELKSYEELSGTPEYETWISGEYEKNIPPNGESGEQMSERVIATFKDFIKTAETESSNGAEAVLVCHGGTIYYIMKYLFPSEEKSLYEWEPSGGCGYLLEYDGKSAENKNVDIFKSWRYTPIGN